MKIHKKNNTDFYIGACYTHEVNKKSKLKKSELKVHTPWLNEMFKRAATPLAEVEAQKEERKKHGESTSKRTRQRKAEAIED